MFSFVALPDSPYQISPYTPCCKFASTSQGRTHQSRSHPPVKVASTSQGRIQQSMSHPPAKVASTSQSRIHQSGSHPPVKVSPTIPGCTHQSRSICNMACTVPLHCRDSLPCRAQYKQEPVMHQNNHTIKPKVNLFKFVSVLLRELNASAHPDQHIMVPRPV